MLEHAQTTPDLPASFSLLINPPGTDAFTAACRTAGEAGAGTLVWSPEPTEILDFAVVLEPDEPLATARRAFLVGMTALVQALAVVAPPDKPLLVDWPDTIRFDGARLGGGRLGWPERCPEDEVPSFLVFGATLTAAKAGDPGLTPDSTSFEEEGFEPGCEARLVEAFARYLMRGFDAWREVSLETALVDCLDRLSHPRTGAPVRIDPVGNLVVAGERPTRAELLPALRQPAWLDERTGRPRL